MNKRLVCWTILLATGLAAPVQAELVGYWKLDEGKGTEFWDQTDYWHDGTIEPWNEAKVQWTTAGYDANGLDFVSATDPFTLCDAPLTQNLLNISEATVSFWMNMPVVFQAWGPIVVLLGGSSDHSVECNGSADFLIADFGTDAYGDLATSGAKLNDAAWHHVAITYSKSGNAMAVYIDGKPAGSQAFNASDPIAAVRIGGPRNRTQWRRYIGRLDEVAVWNHALSAADVKNVCWFGPQWTRFATNPQPAPGETVGTTKITLQWTPGETAAEHRVYVGENADDVKNGVAVVDRGTTTDASFSDDFWELGKTYYWRIDEVEADGTTVYRGTVWSFTVSAKFASNPAPTDGAVLVDTETSLSWTPGAGAVAHDVYMGVDPASLSLASHGQTATSYHPASLEPGTTYHWRVDEHDGVGEYPGEVWTFKTKPVIAVTDPNLVGFWSFDQDENGVAVDWSGRDKHGEILGDPEPLEGYNGKALSFDGVDDRVEVPQVFSVDMTLMAWVKTDVPGPTGTAGREGNGLLWSDHAGGGDHFLLSVLGTKLAFETGPGGNPTTVSNRDVVTGEWVHVAATRLDSSSQVQVFINGLLDATGTHTGDNNIGANPVIVIGGNALDSRYFKGSIDEVRAYDRVLTADEIVAALRGNLSLAWNPSPAMGEAIDVRFTGPLTWSAGDGAAEHDVYLGTDRTTVETATPETAGVYKGRRTDTTFALVDSLLWDTSYYWRIDEVATDGTVVRGNVWSFAVADYLIVDGFEDYTDEEGHRIYQTWGDGYGTSDNGAQVGYTESPFAERTIVHGGRQSMPLTYGNLGGVIVSEARREWPEAQDWTVHGLTTLTLHVRGQTINDPMPLYVTIADDVGRSVTVANADANVATTGAWQEWVVPFSALTPVDMTRVKAMTIGLGDRASPVGGMGLIFIDDIRLEAAR
jgi:hypothetical protein